MGFLNSSAKPNYNYTGVATDSFYVRGMSCVTSSWQYVELLDLTVMMKINALQHCERDILIAVNLTLFYLLKLKLSSN